ncbi:MAG: GyrI-like domain-containing protein [Solirubrobacteraceae bacterium]
MAATKVDVKHRLHELYAPGREPVMVEVPEMAFLMIDGHGDTERAPAFADAVQALYALAYAARFAVRWAPEGIEWGVMPLEGLWSAPDVAAFAAGGDRSTWDWTLMIMQPDRVTPAIVESARAATAARRPLRALAGVRLERFAEGTAAQLLHVGPYAAEGPAIARLHAFVARAGRVPAGRHHEIYLGDPRRAAPWRLKTILRQPVAGR